MNIEQLRQLDIPEEWFEPFQETFARFEINTALRKAAFIGQCGHESGGFRVLEENLNYKPEALMRVWPSRFDAENVDEYAHEPEKIANKVYAGRMGNGNEESGEGWKYHGRGIIQLTGKDNYTLCGDSLQADLLHHPELLVGQQYAALSAGWFWRKHGLNELADTKQYETMTKRINGGLLGQDDRLKRINHALEVLSE